MNTGSLGQTNSTSNPCHVCELCFPDVWEVGSIGEFVTLFRSKEKWGLMGSLGHQGHEFLWFDDEPYPDPDPEKNAEPEDKEAWDKAEAWSEAADRLDDKLVMHVQRGYRLVDDCKKAGWLTLGANYSSVLHYWLFDHCGKMIEAAKQQTGNQVGHLINGTSTPSATGTGEVGTSQGVITTGTEHD